MFILLLASDVAVLCGHDVFSILVLSTEKAVLQFFQKGFHFPEICFKVKVLKTFKISSNCHMKTCRSFIQRALMKIPSTVF